MPQDSSSSMQAHGFSDAAVAAAREALRAGSGRSAQFDHPELGGRGQWMPGMTMIGRMSDRELRARVASLFESLSTDAELSSASHPAEPSLRYDRGRPEDRWYPSDLGAPASSGEQGELRYAYFPAAQRLAVSLRGTTTFYDTQGHTITGVAQAQTEKDGTVTFTSQEGTVRLSDLKKID